jgi:hypothetical protein
MKEGWLSSVRFSGGDAMAEEPELKQGNPMKKPKTEWEKSAQNYFRKAEQTETSLKQAHRKERAADAAKTEKLRALRLAKEAQDKLAAETEAQTNVGVKPVARSRKSKRSLSE